MSPIQSWLISKYKKFPFSSRRFFRFGGGIILGILTLIVFIGLSGWIWLWHSTPSYDENGTIPGLSADVHIIRDAYGVPHIFAQNMTDAARALGYTHAGERLFQMEMQRRAGQGRLSEVVGKDTLSIDKFIRTLGLYSLAAHSFAMFSPEAKDYFQAYADGVNAWLVTHKHSLPPEFTVLHITPELWQPADSVVWGKLMALELSHNYRLEMLRVALAKKIAPSMMAFVFPQFPVASPVTVSPHSLIPVQGVPTKSDVPKKEIDPATKEKKSGILEIPNFIHNRALDYADNLSLDQLGAFTGLRHAASNEWVIAGSRTESGKPILANDPHLGLEAPVLWYLARIVTPDFWIKGATVPGEPLILLGQNDHIAWGLTTTNSDTEDLFIETVDPKNPENYLVPTEQVSNRKIVKGISSAPFETHAEIIHVHGAADETIIVRKTRHGPVLSDIDEEMAKTAGKGKVMALAFTALSDKDTTSEALMEVDHAKNWAEFLKALELYQAPTQNIVYADSGGHIGFINAGLVPVRKTGEGTVPNDGASGAFDWRGMVPFSQLPQVLDPPAGFIFNANNVVIANGSTYYFYSDDWDEPYRARRLQQVFDTVEKHSLVTSAQMQNDITSTAAQELLPVLLRQNPTSKEAQDAYSLLKNWDGRMDQARPEPLIFEAWLYEMHKKLLLEKTGMTSDAMQEKGPYSASVISAILDADDHAWCGNYGCTPVVVDAFNDALLMLHARDGKRMSGWHWGDEHISVITNKVFQHIPILSGLSDLSVPSSGGYYTLERGESAEVDAEHPFLKRQGSGYRGIYDFADPTKSEFMIATGQSGHFLAKHYGDLLPLWNSGRYITLSGTEQNLHSIWGHELILAPAEAVKH